MNRDELARNIKHIDRALDKMAEAAFNMHETNDWVAHAALVTLEGMMDDLGDRLVELRNIRDVMDKIRRDK